MKKQPNEYHRIYIVTDYRKDVKYIKEKLNLKKRFASTSLEKTNVQHLRTDLEPSFRGYHFREDDLIIMGRVNAPMKNIVDLLNKIKNYRPADETAEIIYETG